MPALLTGLSLAVILAGCGDQRPGGQPSGSVPATPAVEPAAPGQVRVCTVCRQPVPGDAKYCIRCGSRLNR